MEEETHKPCNMHYVPSPHKELVIKVKDRIYWTKNC